MPIILIFLASLNLYASQCASDRFMEAGIKMLNLGKCSKETLLSAYNDSLICTDKKSTSREKNYWATKIGSKKFAELDWELLKEKEPVQGQCAEQVSMLIALKTQVLLKNRMNNELNALCDSEARAIDDIVHDCIDTLNTIHTNTKKLLKSRIKYCQLSSGEDRQVFKKKVCQLIPFSCHISITD